MWGSETFSFLAFAPESASAASGFSFAERDTQLNEQGDQKVKRQLEVTVRRGDVPSDGTSAYKQMYDISWGDSYLISEPGMLNVWIPSKPRCCQLTGVLTGRDGAVTGLTGVDGVDGG